MSGRKQHYIPQFILRPFGEVSSGKKTQVRVTTRYKSFVVATDGVAAEREFYLALDSEKETLDDQITQAEHGYSTQVGSLLTCSPDADVSSLEIARLVTHLGMRGNYIRQSFATFGSFAVSRITNLFSQPDYFKKQFGVGLKELTPLMKNKVDQYYNNNRDILRRKKISRHEARKFAVQQINLRWEQFFAAMQEQSNFINSMFDFRQMASEAHNNVLEGAIEPEERVQCLRNLKWKIIDFDHNLLSLPDCIAISYDNELGILPATFLGNEQIEWVILPISPTRAVSGGVLSGPRTLDEIARNFGSISAVCSWDFVITPPSYPQSWVPEHQIGDSIVNLFATKMEEVMTEHLSEVFSN